MSGNVRNAVIERWRKEDLTQFYTCPGKTQTVSYKINTNKNNNKFPTHQIEKLKTQITQKNNKKRKYKSNSK